MTVVFEENVDLERADKIARLITEIRGVQGVKTLIATSEDYFARSRMKNELWKKINEIFLYEIE